MHLEGGILLGESLLRRWPELSDWTLEINSRLVRTLGRCDHSRKVVIVSQALVRLNEEPQIVECVNHEIAHALVGPGHGHGEVWKVMALRTGCKPVSCQEMGRVTVTPGRYTAICPGCTQKFHVYRRLTPNCHRWCKKCGTIKGQLTFVANPAVLVPKGADRLPGTAGPGCQSRFAGTE